MAQLSSPGVSVTVIDESFYTPAAPGTTPLIIVATAENKSNGAGTGTAPGTLKANAGKPYILTSQKDLADTFGTPAFKTDANNNPIHAGEQNEYGLQAAYSYLGVSNRAYVVRADIDLSQLDPKADAPAGAPEDGQYWFDTANSKFGVFQWNSAEATLPSGQTFTNKVPLVVTDLNQIDVPNNGSPKTSVGAVGDYAVVSYAGKYTLWYKKTLTATPAGTWVKVGSSDWKASWPTVIGRTATPSIASGDSLIINGETYTGFSTVENLVGLSVTGINARASTTGITALVNPVTGRLELYNNGLHDDEITISGTNAPDSLGLSSPTGSGTDIYLTPSLQIAPHYSVPGFKRTDNPATVQGYPTGSLWVKSTEPNAGARWRVKVYSSTTASWNEKTAPLYATSAAALKGLDPTGGGINLAVGALYVKTNILESITSGAPDSADFKVYARRSSGATTITTSVLAINPFDATEPTQTFEISETVKGSADITDSLSVTFSRSAGVDGFISALTAQLSSTTLNSSAYTSRISVTKGTAGEVVIKHLDGGDVYFMDGTGTPIAHLFTPYVVGNSTTTANFYETLDGTGYVASNWSPYASITTSATAPTTEATDGQIWYNSKTYEVDIMIHDGTTWKGYQNVYPSTEAPIVAASKPSGSSFADYQLWVDTSDHENYPVIKRWNDSFKRWDTIDTTDQTTEDGILFADARWGLAGADIEAASIEDLLTSDFLDFDAPDPAVYPKGMLLWNLRRSGYNVKKFIRNYVDIYADNPRFNNSEEMLHYYPHRWVTISANQTNGEGTFGRKAQRSVVVQALQALVNSNQAIRDEEYRVFNLIACPGYTELINEMVSLNYDRGLTAFVVGDTPARLTADATSLSNWGQNVMGAPADSEDGLVSFDEYLGVFYPWGYSSDNLGNDIAVPPSHMMLRTIALNDNVSYPWFAPAGTRRGGITNATAVGYITNEGEFQSVALNNGQRDVLQKSCKINPLTYITGTGLVNYGQMTRAKNASALDRINVARLVIYLRRQFAQLAKPYVFEPNDKITRDELKGAAESLLIELVGQRALYDYIVVCDTSNNTPARIDRNELYLDVAIEPVKAVEFIYIPLRLKNTGEIAGLQ